MVTTKTTHGKNGVPALPAVVLCDDVRRWMRTHAAQRWDHVQYSMSAAELVQDAIIEYQLPRELACPRSGWLWDLAVSIALT